MSVLLLVVKQKIKSDGYCRVQNGSVQLECEMSEDLLQVLPHWHSSSIRANSAYTMLAHLNLQMLAANPRERIHGLTVFGRVAPLGMSFRE